MTRRNRWFINMLDPRNSVRHYGPAVAVAAVAAMTVFAGFLVLLWHADWLEFGSLRGLTPNQRVIAVDDARGRLIQLGAGMLAGAALLFTALNFWLSREGHVTDRYTKAVEQLGSDRMDVRLGAIYALERIMIDSTRDHGTIVEVLAAFVREHSPAPTPGTPYEAANAVTTDVQAVLTVLSRRPARRKERGSLNLAGANLKDADLRNADLTGAVLGDAYLAGAHLSQAQLRYAFMVRANLSNAMLAGADLSYAVALDAEMRGTNFRTANLTGVALERANLSNADFGYARLVDARLDDATMSATDLTDADLTGTTLSDTQTSAAIGVPLSH